MAEIDCVLKERARQLAVERGLLKPGQNIDCRWAAICTGLRCFLGLIPQTKFITLNQSGQNTVKSPVDRFNARLTARDEILFGKH